MPHVFEQSLFLFCPERSFLSGAKEFEDFLLDVSRSNSTIFFRRHLTGKSFSTLAFEKNDKEDSRTPFLNNEQQMPDKDDFVAEGWLTKGDGATVAQPDVGSFSLFLLRACRHRTRRGVAKRAASRSGIPAVPFSASAANACSATTNTN